MSDQSTGQPSPVSLSPTPPSTPSPYGFSYPQGYATIGSPGQIQMATTPSLSSPPSLAGTLTKARPTPKPPRQRPSLPPPQPPSTPGSSPQPLEHSAGLLDGLSPGESMSTGKVFQTKDYYTSLHVYTLTGPNLYFVLLLYYILIENNVILLNCIYQLYCILHK